jgi:hypothetical protein
MWPISVSLLEEYGAIVTWKAAAGRSPWPCNRRGRDERRRLKRTNILKIALVAIAVTVTACVLALVIRVESSQAAFPGQNGKIVFVSNRDGNVEIYTMNADGSNQTNISNNKGSDQYPAWPRS